VGELPRHYALIAERQVEKALRQMPKSMLTCVDRLCLRLADEPHPAGSRKPKRNENLDRLRVGDWRLIYAVEDDRLVVPVIETAPRGEAYRGL
jgi:mRNA interferase RelE/StbE